MSTIDGQDKLYTACVLDQPDTPCERPPRDDVDVGVDDARTRTLPMLGDASASPELAAWLPVTPLTLPDRHRNEARGGGRRILD